MSIDYVCTDCNIIFHFKGFEAVNEVGRKYCTICNNNDNNLLCVSSDVVINSQMIIEKTEYVTEYKKEFIKLTDCGEGLAEESALLSYLFIMKNSGLLNNPDMDARDDIRAMI